MKMDKPFNKPLKRLILWTTLIGILFLATGCWSSAELNNRAFAGTVIIDRNDNGIELTLGFPLPNRIIPGQAGGSSSLEDLPYVFVTNTGSTIQDAINKTQSAISRRITFGQTHAIILGSKFAERGIEPLIEFATRNPNFKINSSLFFVDSPAAPKVSETPVYFERFLLSVLNSYIRNHNFINVTVRDLLFSIHSEGDGIVPVLSFSKTTFSPSTSDSPSLGTGGAAVLKEGKFVKMLPPVTVTSILSILGQLQQVVYTVPSPSDGKSIGMFTKSGRTKIIPVLRDGTVTILLKCKAEASVISSDSNLDLTSHDALMQLEHAIEKQSNEQILSTIKQIQKSGSDAFDFGNHIEARYPKIWKTLAPKWREYYQKELKVTVQTDIILNRTGASSKSVHNEFGLESSND